MKIVSDDKPKPDTEEATETMADIMKRNAENKEREKRDRAKANQSVTRSYRLKKD